MKLFMFLVNAVYWLWIFIIPAALCSFLAYWMYAKDPGNAILSVFLVISGILSGIFLAEKVRKKYGLSDFFAEASATPDIENKPGEDNTP